MAPSGRELSPQVTEGELGRLSHRFAQGIDLPRTSRSLWHTPPIASKPFGLCGNLPPSWLRHATSLYTREAFGLAKPSSLCT